MVSRGLTGPAINRIKQQNTIELQKEVEKLYYIGIKCYGAPAL